MKTITDVLYFIGKIIIIGIVVFVLFRLLNLGNLYLTFEMISGYMQQKTGLNKNLLYAIAVPLTFVLSHYFSVLIFGLDKQKRQVAKYTIASLLALFYFTSFLLDSSSIKRVQLTKETRIFSPSGESLIWYYEGINGEIEFFDNSGVHPQFGVPLKVVDKEVVKKAMEQNNVPKDAYLELLKELE